MYRLSEILKSRVAHILSSVFLAFIWSLFAYSQMLAFLKSYELSPLLLCISETLIVVFFIFRSRPQTISVHPLDWIAATVASFLPLFFRPAPWGIFPPAKFIMIAGAFLMILSILSLNRSFAMVAAKREIKTNLMYRLVRHPLYCSYCVVFSCYVLTNTTLENTVIFLITMMFFCIRIFREEKHLALDPAYREYMLKVRYRLIPYLF